MNFKNVDVQKSSALLTINLGKALIIILLIGSGLTAWSEASSIHSYAQQLYGKEHANFLASGGIYPIITYFLTLALPGYVIHATNKHSVGGQRFDVIELIISLLIALAILFFTYTTYEFLHTTLEGLTSTRNLNKRIENVVAKSAESRNVALITAQLVMDTLIALLAAAEVRAVSLKEKNINTFATNENYEIEEIEEVEEEKK